MRHGSTSDAARSSDGSDLLRLSTADQPFGLWCDRVGCTILDSAEDQAVAVRTSGIQWDCLGQQLPRLLITDTSWHHPRSPDDATCPANMLLAGVNLVLRLDAMEGSFARELEKTHTQALYNFAYGLSHELNNPLANIATRAGVLLQDTDAASDRQLLSAIVDNAMRGSEMLGDLMLIARPPSLEIAPQPATQFLDRLLSKATPIAEQRQIELGCHFGENLPNKIPLDAAAMTEAIWCLIRNAFEALPTGGRVDVSMTAAARHVHIQINDNGMGLSSAGLKNCFDTFYSGREAGRGLGIGLAKAKRLIELHSGNISIANRIGGGASAIVLLPRE